MLNNKGYLLIESLILLDIVIVSTLLLSTIVLSYKKYNDYYRDYDYSDESVYMKEAYSYEKE